MDLHLHNTLLMRYAFFLVAEQYYHSSTNVSPEDLSDLTVIPNFITEAQETTLLREIDKTWKRMKYEYSHWDDVR